MSIFHKIPFDGASIKALRGRVNAKIEAIRAGSVRLKFRQFIVDSKAVDSKAWYFYTPGIKVEEVSRFQLISGSEMQRVVGSLFVTMRKPTGRSMSGRK